MTKATRVILNVLTLEEYNFSWIWYPFYFFFSLVVSNFKACLKTIRYQDLTGVQNVYIFIPRARDSKIAETFRMSRYLLCPANTEDENQPAHAVKREREKKGKRLKPISSSFIPLLNYFRFFPARSGINEVALQINVDSSLKMTRAEKEKKRGCERVEERVWKRVWEGKRGGGACWESERRKSTTMLTFRSFPRQRTFPPCPLNVPPTSNRQSPENHECNAELFCSKRYYPLLANRVCSQKKLRVFDRDPSCQLFFITKSGQSETRRCICSLRGSREGGGGEERENWKSGKGKQG